MCVKLLTCVNAEFRRSDHSKYNSAITFTTVQIRVSFSSFWKLVVLPMLWKNG